MKKLIVAAALATLIGAPAFAQSYDPEVGSGNLVGPPNAVPGAWNAYRNGTGAYARAPFASGPAWYGQDYYYNSRGGLETEPQPNAQFRRNRQQ